ncbi:hypothetical protein, partial [Streptomyces sp. NPDC015350]|uniref:hypothetical protein n=1 Tax=Streptomyces sp. NPDC015350 TaxID=3364955 RepID=UPI0036FF4F70
MEVAHQNVAPGLASDGLLGGGVRLGDFPDGQPGSGLGAAVQEGFGTRALLKHSDRGVHKAQVCRGIAPGPCGPQLIQDVKELK